MGTPPAPAPDQAPPPVARSASYILISAIADALKPFIYSVSVVGCFYVSADAVKAFAGKLSFADLRLVTQIFAGAKFSLGVTIAVTGSGWIYGLIQRQLRRKTIERLQTRIIEFEKGVDPSRSSSHLTKRGTTREEDRI